MRLFLIILTFYFSLLADDTVVKIGVLAKRGIEPTFKKWEDTATYLTQKIPNRKFEIVPLGFDSLVEDVGNKKIDFILANSGFYVELEYKHGVQRITTLINQHISGLSQKEFGGVIFSHIKNKDRFQTLEDIKGAHFAAVNEKSLGGWQMAWRELAQRGIDRESDLASISFKQTHDNVVYAILRGDADVGTVRSDTLERMAMEEKIDLNDFHIIEQRAYENFPFLTSTRLYPEWPFAKLKHTNDELSKEVAVALMQMTPEDRAAKSASIAGWTTPLSYQPVHQCFKFLKISPYYQEIKFLEVVQKYLYWIIFYFFLVASGITMLIYQYRLTKHLRKTQNELVQTEKMASLGRLVAGVSHEVNTPIGISVTAASHLKDEAQKFQVSYENETLTQEGFEAFIKTSIQSSEYILVNLDRAAQMVRNFKQISVDQSSDVVREFNIHEYLQGILHSLNPKIKKTAHTIEIDCPKEYNINSHPGAFYQIFTNLILNSFIHGFENIENGHITIRVLNDKGHLHIVYKDNGKGVPANIIKQIFDPFFTTKRSSGGSGLGTHIIYNLVTQKLGGSITIDSKEGMGLTYNMIFKGIRYV